MTAAARPWPADHLAAYATWLLRQPFSAHTRRAYRVQVAQYCTYLAAMPAAYGDPLREPHARDYAVRDYKTHLKTVRRSKPRTVNLALAAIDHFYRFLGTGRPVVGRENLPQLAPHALDATDQKQFVRAVERCPSLRDRAVGLLLFYTGLRISECAALDLDDVPRSERKGLVIVRTGKGNAYREVPLNAPVRKALDAWATERGNRFIASHDPALFLTRQGHRLSARAIDLLVRRLGRAAGLDLSAQTLRHTWVTNLVRQGTDLVLVAELAGHKRLETTRRYSLPSLQDRIAVLEALEVEA
jgi:site-specific recombinase XerD